MCDIVAAEQAKVGASLDTLIIATQNAIDAKQPRGGWKLAPNHMAIKFSF